MRSLIVSRKKMWAGSFITFLCVLGETIEEFKKTYKDDAKDFKGDFYPIANGETIKVAIEEKTNSLFVIAETASGLVCSNELFIGEGKKDFQCEVKLQYSLLKKSSLTLTMV